MISTRTAHLRLRVRDSHVLSSHSLGFWTASKESKTRRGTSPSDNSPSQLDNHIPGSARQNLVVRYVIIIHDVKSPHVECAVRILAIVMIARKLILYQK